MRKAVMHALSSSEDTTTPFLVVLVLPVWENTPWTSAGIRNHRNLETLIQIPTGHMRFVPAHKQTDNCTAELSPAIWPVELVRISNQEVRNRFVSTDRITHILAPALQKVCQMTAEQIKFFPNKRTTKERSIIPPPIQHTRPLPICPATISPSTPPAGRPRPPQPTPTGAPALPSPTSLPTYTIPPELSIRWSSVAGSPQDRKQS